MRRVLKGEWRVFTRSLYLPFLFLAAWGYLNIHLGRLLAKVDKATPDTVLFFLTEDQRQGFLSFFVFLFLAFEFGSRLRESRAGEWMAGAPSFAGKVLAAKVLILEGLVALFSLNVLGFDLFWILRVKTATGPLVWQALRAGCLNYLLPGTVAVLGGLALSQRLKRASGYALLTGLVVFVSPLLDPFLNALSAGKLEMGRGKDFFTLFAQGLLWVPDPLYGLPAEWCRFLLAGFWLVLTLFSLCLPLLKKPGHRWGAMAVALACCAALLPTSFMRVGSFSKYGDDHLARSYGFSEELYHFYEKEGAAQKTKPADFSVQHYEMDLHFGAQLEATVKMNVDVPCEVLYFTLNHRYRVKEVTGAEGTPLPYQRESDYLAVEAGGQQAVKVVYAGFDTVFYAGRSAVLLPGFFAFYPIAGYWPTYDSSYQAYLPVLPTGEKEFSLRVRGREVACNLPQTEEGFAGRAETITLLGGLAQRGEIDGIHLYTLPLQNGKMQMSRAEIDRELAGASALFGAGAPALPAHFSGFEIPANLMPANREMIFFSDHLLAGTARVDPEQAAIQYLYRTLDLRDHDKRVVAQIYLSYLTDDDYRHDVHYEEESNRGYRYEGNKARFVFPPMLGLAIERQGEEKVQKEIIRYLQNPDDRRDAYSFFSDLAGWDEEVSRVEAEMAANA